MLVISLSPEQFAQVFPFHVVFDAETCVRQFGPSLQRMLPAISVGQPLSRYFRIKRPRIAVDYACVVESCQRLFLLECLGTDVVLKGQMLPMDSENMIAFLCSPWVTDLQSLQAMGISLTDFAVHDPISDYLFLLQAKDTTLAESTKLQEELIQRTQQIQRGIEEVRERESRFKAAAESLSDALVIADDRGMIEFWNATAERVFGWTSQEAVGQPLQSLMPQRLRESHAKGFRSAAERGVLAHGGAPLKLRALHKDGTEFPVTVTLSTWTAAGRRRFAAVMQDTTTADLAETRMRQAQRARVVAAGLATTVFEAHTEQEFLDGVARLVVEQGRYRLCWVALKVGDEAKTVAPVALHGVDDGYEDFLQITWGEDNGGRGPTGTAIREGRVTISRDLAAGPAHGPSRQAGLEGGFRSAIALPLRVDHDVIGALSVYADEADAFQEEEIAILEALTGNVSLGVAALRADEERKREADVRRQAEQALQHERESLAERVEERTAELSAAYAQLEGASRAKDEFLAAMSHELRTPLNTILTLSESLEEGVYGALCTEQVKPLRTVMSSGAHLLSLINDLLDLAKIGAGKIDLNMRRVSVRDICDASLRLVKETARKKQLRFSTSIDFRVETILADERRLKQILVNLLSNAVKFTDPGGEVGIEVTGDPERELMEFVVWDTGIGLREDQMKMLFEPFSQVDAGLDRRFEGTGLGLALVSRMTELHGGGVTVQSGGLGKGSRFAVSLPWTEDAQGRESEDSVEPSVDDDRLNEGLPHDAPRILIADDNENTLRTLGRYFRSKSFRVSVARHGEEAVVRALEDQPDAILMDIQMPKMDGLEATRRIRDGEGSSRVPIIAVTALAMPGDRERCLAAGVDVYLTKPVSLRLLAERVGELTGNRSGP